MLRLLLILPLISLCIGNLAAQAPVRTLRVVTYNIHHGLGTDQQLNLDRIVDVLREAQPDLVALQEVDVRTRRSLREDQAVSLGQKLGMNVGFGKAINHDDGEYGNCILSKSPIDEFQTYPLSTIEGHEARSVSVGGFDSMERGRRFNFYPHTSTTPPKGSGWGRRIRWERWRLNCVASRRFWPAT